jgi:dipeptidyl aminopeptidase/acylaminoacyl peptidase
MAGKQTGVVSPWRLATCLSLLLLTCGAAATQAQQGYQKPPKAVLDILNAPPPPVVSFSPTRDHFVQLEANPYPTIAELAEPTLRLAGHRINPQTNGPHRPPRFVGLSLHSFDMGKHPDPLAPPDTVHFGMPVWSPDGKHLAFTNTTGDAIELWVVDVAPVQIRRIGGVRLNACYGPAIHWMPDNQTLLCKLVVAERGQPPAAPKVPTGPTIQESVGKQAPVRTYQDLLKNKHDEALFDYYFTAQLGLVDTKTEKVDFLGKPAIFASAQISPDGKHFLVAQEHRPYSYLHPSFAFPKEVEVWDRQGHVEFKLASLPLAEQVPIEGVPTGPRDYEWRPTEPATLVWVEALDGGDPRKAAPQRDRVLMLPFPFQASPAEIARTEQRFFGLVWGEKRELALLSDYDRDSRRRRTFVINADQPEQTPRKIWDRSVLDRYRDPGTPVMKTLANGHQALWQSGKFLFLSGAGASRTGDHPFLDRFDLETGASDRLFQSDPAVYESVVALAADKGPRFITRRESPQEPPNYFLRSTDQKASEELTNFTDPTPQLRSIKKQLVTYKRADGVQLSFTLYLPPNYQSGQRLPTIVWAYPREFTDAGTAGQVAGSAQHFTTIGGISHLFLLTQGYAVLDGATMPVVGPPETANNTFIEQIVASARAAIDKAVELGVTDRSRVGVGGHSYGAFMTANLLAHSDLFRAGVARSGAYNRTLTPFGFQSERRTLWEAPEIYLKVSPFQYANKIKTPILIIHGEADDNPGTFPVQSERLYQAIKGNGGTVRYVTLPLEAHGYQARESVEHTLYEMIAWFDKYVKNARVEASNR